MGFLIKNLVLAIPFYFLWNGLAPIYFQTWPEAYHKVPFFDCVAFMVLLAVIRMALMPFDGPKVISNFTWRGPGTAGPGARRRSAEDNIVDVN